MSDMTYPVVHPDERVIIYDFNRLSDRVEDVLAQWVIRFMLDPSKPAYATGVVLHGFRVDQIDLPANQVRVQRGAALVPLGAVKDATRDDASAGMSASWRLVITTADIIVNLALPGVGERTDFLMVAREYVNHAVEAREFRVPGDPDDAAVNQNVVTLRRPQGAVVQGTAYQVGAVKLYEVDLDTDGATELRDVRVMAWPVDSDSPANLSSTKPHAHGLMAALGDLFERVPKVIHPDGLRRVISPADGGPNIEVDDNLVWGHYVALNERLLVTQRMLFRQIVIRDPIATSSFEAEAKYVGMSLTGSNIPRAYGIIRVTKDEDNDVSAVDWVGHGIASVSTVDGDYFDVTFNAVTVFIAAFAGFGGLTTSRWIVSAQPHHMTPGYADEPNSGGPERPKLCTVEALNDTTARIRCFAHPDPGDWEPRPFSVWVQLFGPILPSLGAEPAAWTGIFP